MTAFGRSRFSLNGRAHILEIQSVNRKGLEISVNIPSDLGFVEIFLRTEIKKMCQRGYLTCKILNDSSVNHRMSSESFKKIHENLVGIAQEIDPNYKISFDHVLEVALRGTGIIEIEEKEAEKIIKVALDNAINDFLLMRTDEGEALGEDISDRLIQIGKVCRRISEKGAGSPKRLEDRITERLKEVVLLGPEDRDRLMREVIIYADRADITEEITRLRSHIEQMQELVKGKKERKEEAIGRTLEFLLQEMVREINTTSAKSQDLEIINDVIFIKREIEKIREQVQNIE